VPLRALALNCTLKPSPAETSTGVLLSQLCDALEDHDVSTTTVRVVDHDVKPGVSSDEGKGDEWPAIREQILAAQILVIGTPIWLGHPSSVCQQTVQDVARHGAHLARVLAASPYPPG
jgi:multimeric flavodoxin WrbA